MRAHPSENATSSRTFRALLLAASLVASAAFGFRAKIEPLDRGIDASYLFAANYASSRGWRFGEDFVSTYGPYGYCIYASNVADIPSRKLVSEFALVVLVGAACAAYVGSHKLRKGASVAAGVLLVYSIHVQGDSDFGDEYRWFSALVLLVIVALRSTDAAGLVPFFLASCLAGFFVLVKLSLGAGAVLTILAACLLTRRPSVAAARIALLSIGAALGFAFAWMAHHGTLAGTGAFFGSASELVSGYSSAMSGSSEWRENALYFGAFAATLGGIALSSRGSGAAMTLLACGAPLFVAWKHAMVLGTPRHAQIFMLFGLFLVGVILVSVLDSKRRWVAALLVAPSAFLFAPWIHYGASETWGTSSLSRTLAEPLGIPGWERWRSTREGSSRTSTRSFEKLRLPETLRARVGGEPTDVYPWESLYVAANDLSWASRPSTASFATFTPGLDRRNAQFFTSARAPTHVLWHRDRGVLSTHLRHVFWDEPETLRALVSSYSLGPDEDGKVLLLKKRDRPRLASPRPFGEEQTRWGEWIDVPRSDGVVLARLSFERPWWTRLVTLLLRDAPMYISVRFESGGEETYRFVPAQAGSGLWISPLPRDAGEIRSILAGDFSSPRVRAIRTHGSWEEDLATPVVVSWLEVAPSPE